MKRFTFTTFLILICFNFSFAQLSGASALFVLEDIDKKITRQLNSLDNLVTNSIGNTGNLILSITARLKKDINETIGNTDTKLREKQLSLYNQILTLTEDFDKTIKENISDLDVIASRATQTIDDFFGKNKEPNIYKFDSEVFIDNYDKDYSFSVIGKNFDRSYKVFFYINNKEIEPSLSTFKKLTFVIDSTNIHSSANNSNYVIGEVVFKWKKGLFNSKKEKKEKFIIPIVPLNIGNAKAYYEQELPKKIFYKQERTYKCSTGSSNWKGEREKESTVINIIPVAGRSFDKNSIKKIDWSQRYGGNWSFSSKTEQQIIGEITCSSETQPYGGGGRSQLTFTYNEFEIKYETTDLNTKELPITSVNPIIVELPEPVDGNRPNLRYVKINTFDNREVIVSPNESNKYFNLKINPVTDDITVSLKK